MKKLGHSSNFPATRLMDFCQGGCLSLCGETLVDPRLGMDFRVEMVVKIDKP